MSSIKFTFPNFETSYRYCYEIIFLHSKQLIGCSVIVHTRINETLGELLNQCKYDIQSILGIENPVYPICDN